MQEPILHTDLFSAFGALGFPVLALIFIAFLGLIFSSYVRIVTVLGIVRTGFGFDAIPSAFVTGALAMALSLLVMYPTLKSANQSMERVLQGRSAAVSDEVRAKALGGAVESWKEFLSRHAGKSEIERFTQAALELDKRSGSRERDLTTISSSWQVLGPAFVVSELKSAFATGLGLLLPFLVIDLLVVTLLTAVGLDSQNPVVVALPLKLLVFVLVDGWGLITANLVRAYS